MGECYSHLSYVERLTIDEGLRAGLSSRAIARRLGRAASTVSREVARMGPYAPHYIPAHSLFTALRRRSQCRRGARKLTPGSPLFEHVDGQLRAGWSPLQIAGRLRRMDEATRPGTVSHECIYTALYALPRGELRRELLSVLRQGRQNRRPRSRGQDRRKGFVSEDIRIAERPEEVAGRLEVLRGPQGTLFGRNATAGAISIITRDPKDEIGFRQDVTVGNYSQLKTRTTIDTGKFGAFSAFVTYVHDERRGDTRNLGAGTVLDRTDPFLNYGKQISPKYLRSKNGESIFAALKFEPSDNLTMTYKFDWSDTVSTPEVRAVTVINPLAGAGFLLNLLLATQPVGGGIYGATFTNPSDRRPKVFNNAWTTRAALKTQGHNFTIVWEATDNLTIRNTFAYRKAKSYGFTTIVGLDGLQITAATSFLTGGTVGNLFSSYGGNNAGKNHQYSDELQFNYSSDRVNITAGLLWYDSYEDFGLPGYNGNIAFRALPLSNLVPLGNVAQQDSSTTSLAAYVQAEFQISDQLSVVAGGRVTQDKKKGNLEIGGVFVGDRTTGSIVGTTDNPFRFKKTKPTFSIGLNYKPNDDILLYGKFSTAFLSGGAVGVLSFAPETVSAFEGGIKSDWLDGKLRLNLTAWHAKYKHSQAANSGAAVGQPQLSVVVIDNGPLEAWGLEFEAVVKPTDGLTFSGNLGYTAKHTLSSPNPIYNVVQLQNYKHGGIPTLVGSVSAQYETPPLFGDATMVFRVDGTYQSKFRAFSDDNINVPGTPTYIAQFAPYEFNPQRWLVNGRIALRDIEVGGANAEIGLWGRNLFNVKKPMFPFPFGNILFTNSYQEARTLGVDISLRFGSHR